MLVDEIQSDVRDEKSSRYKTCAAIVRLKIQHQCVNVPLILSSIPYFYGLLVDKSVQLYVQLDPSRRRGILSRIFTLLHDPCPTSNPSTASSPETPKVKVIPAARRTRTRPEFYPLREK